MVTKFNFRDLRNPEYFQFMVSVRDIFVKHEAVSESFGCLCDDLTEKINVAEIALAAERRNEKVREKNEADRYRDRLHSKLFNYLKSILYDEKDPRFDDAQQIMKIIKEAGNPTRLSENAQSAMMTALGNKLEPLRQQLEATGALTTVTEMLEANRQFIALETEYREMIATRKLDGTPASMNAARKEIDPIYRSIVAAINGYVNIPSKKEAYRELAVEINVLVTRYDTLLATRKREKKETTVKPNPCDECVEVTGRV